MIKPEQLKDKMVESFPSFCRILQGKNWFDDNVHEDLCNWIQGSIEEGITNHPEEITKLLIVLPRGSLKTTLCTKLLPAWLNAQDILPDGTKGCDVRSLIVSNTMPNARKKVQDIRGLYDSHEIFRNLFPEMLPTRDCRWTNELAEIPRTQKYPDGTYESAGTGTKKVGSHYNCLIEDDTVAPGESDMKMEITAPSQDEIDRGIGFHKAATPLLVPRGFRLRVVVTTRWADEDLAHYVKTYEDYHTFDVPAKSEDGKRLFLSFYKENTLKDLEVQLGPYLFSALYLNQPIEAGLRTFNKDWFQYIDEDAIPTHDANNQPLKSYRTLAIDPAISKKETACETALTEVLHVIKGTKAFQYWTKDHHGHMNPLETVNMALDWCEERGIGTIIVETVAYQESLKYYLYDEMAKRGIRVNIVPLKRGAGTGKDARIEAMVPYFASGRIFFVRGNLSPQVESQLIQFPHGRLKDVIDSFSMHMKQSTREKSLPRPTEAEKTDPNSGEAVLEQVKAAYLKHAGGSQFGILTQARRFEPGIPTGLGLETDLELMFRNLNLEVTT